jgi:hypothetical protein
MNPTASASATTQGFRGEAADEELLGRPKGSSSSNQRIKDTIFFQPITGQRSFKRVLTANPAPKETLKETLGPSLEPSLKEAHKPTLKPTPTEEEPDLVTTRGGAPPENPISQGILNLLFICFLYWVSTKILLFYGISNDIYLVYFMFYVFLYATTLLLPTSYERFD